MSGRAVEAAGDVHTLLLDKTGTITLGNRQATEFAAGHQRSARRRGAARVLPDETRKGARLSSLRRRNTASVAGAATHEFVRSRRRRMSGINLDGREIRKGPVTRLKYVVSRGGTVPRSSPRPSAHRACGWDTVVAEGRTALGVIRQKDIVKAESGTLRALAGDGDQDGDDYRDNPLTAAATADKRRRLPVPNAPEDKMALIKANRRTAARGVDWRRDQ